MCMLLPRMFIRLIRLPCMLMIHMRLFGLLLAWATVKSWVATKEILKGRAFPVDVVNRIVVIEWKFI